MKKEGLINE